MIITRLSSARSSSRVSLLSLAISVIVTVQLSSVMNWFSKIYSENISWNIYVNIWEDISENITENSMALLTDTVSAHIIVLYWQIPLFFPMSVHLPTVIVWYPALFYSICQRLHPTQNFWVFWVSIADFWQKFCVFCQKCCYWREKRSCDYDNKPIGWLSNAENNKENGNTLLR